MKLKSSSRSPLQSVENQLRDDNTAPQQKVFNGPLSSTIEVINDQPRKIFIMINMNCREAFSVSAQQVIGSFDCLLSSTIEVPANDQISKTFCSDKCLLLKNSSNRFSSVP